MLTKKIIANFSLISAGFLSGLIFERCYHSMHTKYIGNIRIDNSDGVRAFLEITDIESFNTAIEGRVRMIRESYVRNKNTSYNE